MNTYYRALLSKCVAERDEALATLNTYFNNSVGIGEHPQMVEEANEVLDKLATADDKLEKLKKYFKNDGTMNNLPKE